MTFTNQMSTSQYNQFIERQVCLFDVKYCSVNHVTKCWPCYVVTATTHPPVLTLPTAFLQPTITPTPSITSLSMSSVEFIHWIPDCTALHKSPHEPSGWTQQHSNVEPLTLCTDKTALVLMPLAHRDAPGSLVKTECPPVRL